MLVKVRKKSPSFCVLSKQRLYYSFCFYYQGKVCLLCQTLSGTLTFVFSPKRNIRPKALWSFKASKKVPNPPSNGVLLLELITLSSKTKYSGHTVRKEAHSITKLLSTGRLLPFITCKRWNSLLVKGNGCFTALPQINICRHFLFLLCYKK